MVKRGGELLRWWQKEMEDLRDQHVGENRHVCESNLSLLFFQT
jgi:hypothetical protein